MKHLNSLSRVTILIICIGIFFGLAKNANLEIGSIGIAQAATKSNAVILYATSWCPYCVKVRQFLKKNKIEFMEYDIEKSKEGMKQYRKVGGQGIPVIVIGGKTVIQGYDEEAILKAYRGLKI